MDNYDVTFRAYDIRGEYNKDFDDSFAYTLGKSFGTYIQKMGKKKVLVGYDNRISSPALKDNLIKGLVETGVDVVLLGLVTTPMFYCARYRLDIWSGIMITASHNPKDDNGFKLSFDEKGNAKGEEIQAFKEFTREGNFISGNGTLSEYDIKEDYIDLICSSIFLKDRKKVVFDCGNGTCSFIIKDILDRLNVEYDLLYCDSDPSFPNHHPDPAVNSNLVDLQKRVVELGYDMGIAVDADGDRVRIVDNKGNIINSDIYLVIMYRYMHPNMENKKALFDIKCSKALIDALDELDMEYIMYRTGNSYMFRKTREENVELSGEYSGHIWYNDRFATFDDGIYAGLRMLEVISNTGKSVNELASRVNPYYSTEELKIKTTESGKVYIVDKVKEYAKSKGYKYNDIDGVRIEFVDGWALVRFSNTGPNVTVRYEGNSENRKEEIVKEFTDVINKIMEDL